MKWSKGKACKMGQKPSFLSSQVTSIQPHRAACSPRKAKGMDVTTFRILSCLVPSLWPSPWRSRGTDGISKGTDDISHGTHDISHGTRDVSKGTCDVSNSPPASSSSHRGAGSSLTCGRSIFRKRGVAEEGRGGQEVRSPGSPPTPTASPMLLHEGASRLSASSRACGTLLWGPWEARVGGDLRGPPPPPPPPDSGPCSANDPLTVCAWPEGALLWASTTGTGACSNVDAACCAEHTAAAPVAGGANV